MVESLQPLAEGVATTFFVLATITILLRIYSRGFIVKHFGLDDWCMLSILFFNSGQQAILYYFIRHGGGLRIQKVMTEHPEWMNNLIHALFAEEIVYTWMHFIIKMAFLLFYLRFATKLFRKLVYVSMGINAVFSLVTILIYCFQCIPLDAFFNPQKHPNVKCVDNSVLAFVPAAFSISMDILIVVLPIRPLWAIQVSLRKRLALICIICLGGIVVLISCIRLVVLLEFQKKNADFTYVLGKLIIISSIELEVAIMAANAPSLKILFQMWFFDKKHSSNHTANVTDGKKAYGESSRSQKGRSGYVTETGYAVDCTKSVAMADREARKNDEHRLQHFDSDEQLWKGHESGIMVDRSVAVEVSNSADGKLGRNTTVITRETSNTSRSSPSPSDEKAFKDNFEAV